MDGRRASETLRLSSSPELVGVGIPVGDSISTLDDDRLPSNTSTSDGGIHQKATNTSQIKRFQSIARYEAFQPQALACSPPLYPMDMAVDGSSGAITPSSSSLGAVAGSHGVAIFQVSQPHVPRMVLSHHASATSTRATCALAFQSTSLLASGCENSVLVWDVSGQSLSPLQGRLSAAPPTTSDTAQGSCSITDLAWWTSSTLLTLSSSLASFWDLRQRAPSLRFGANKEGAKNIQITRSDRETYCAILDAAGFLRLYDVRMMGSARVTRLGEFAAHSYAGVGLDYLPSQRAWVTWGLDQHVTGGALEGVVKVWKGGDTNESSQALLSSDEYWYTDGSPENSKSVTTKSPPSAGTGGVSYREHARCTVRNLACARVCPSPVQDCVVTISVKPKDGDSLPNWRADVWKLDDDSPNSMEHVVAFKSNAGNDTNLLSMVGSPVDVSSLRGAELAVSSYTGHISGNDSDYGIVLCTLSDQGYITTHAIPEALPEEAVNLKQRRSAESLGLLQHPSVNAELQVSATKLIPGVNGHSKTVGDAAFSWTRKVSIKAPNSHLGVANRTVDHPSVVDVDVPLSYSLSAAPSGLVSPDNISAFNSSTERKRDVGNNIPIVDKDRIPSPGMCGARFSAGVGGLVVFNNSKVKRVWSWWQRRRPVRQSVCQEVIGAPVVEAQQLALSKYPKTLQDFVHMKEAAAEARWRVNEDNTVDSSSGMPVDGTPFFDSDSEASTDSGDETRDMTALIYEEYFNDYKQSLHEIMERQPEDIVEGGEDPSRNFHAGDRADLSWTVFVSPMFRHQRLSNNQNARLARALEFGGVPGDEIETAGKSPPWPPTPREPQTRMRFDDRGQILSSPTRQRLPSYRSLLPSKSPSSVDRAESGVHGGEYAVRPNVQESMIFLRKLFAHQQQDNGTSASAQKHSSNEEETSRFQSSSSEHDSFGVQTQEPIPRNKAFTDGVIKIEASCAHNVAVCHKLGDTDKANSWNLIKQVVSDQKIRRKDEYDGWQTGAINVGVVDSILKYYESRGDSQMLSSVVALLRSGERAGIGLLRQNQDKRYNGYITRYAQLLYGWDLLSLRAAYMKWLRLPLDSKYQAKAQDYTTVSMEVLFECPRCSTTDEESPVYCRTCQDFSFRCSLCDHAVHSGLFTICESCGHGGHVNHMKMWFEENEACPTGCGCQCPLARQREADTFLPREESKSGSSSSFKKANAVLQMPSES